LCGIGFLWTWGYAAFYLSGLTAFGGSYLGVTAVMMTSQCSLVISFVALVVLDRRILPIIVRREPYVACSAALSVLTALCALLLNVALMPSCALGVAMGIVSAWLFCAWGMVFGRADAAQAGFTTPIAALITAGLCALLSFAPPAACLAATIVMPLVSCAFLRKPVRESWPLAHIRAISPGRVLSMMRRFLASFFALSICLGVFRGVLGNSDVPDPVPQLALFFVGMALGCLAILATWLAKAVRGHTTAGDETYRAVPPLALASMLSLMLLPPESSWVSSVLSGIWFSCFDVGGWVLVADATVRARISPLTTFGLLRAFGNGGMLVGSLFGGFARPGTAAVEVILAVTCLVVACTASSSMSRIDVLGAPTSDVSPGSLETTLRGQNAEEIARIWGLTDRETDVLRLMLDGRELPQIERTLALSRSTVKTHTRHIYDKLGVHSRQELYELCDRIGG
jgi:DNA-binding CsgD family transcriptional regulator